MKEKLKARQENVGGLFGNLFKDSSVFTTVFTSLSEEVQKF
jgi:hypothetical protein